ncbi:unnamed protein product [Oppiella nova]|uniref:Carboxylic ester hydrolase n=1 Tax=Oppiella nova TaxID=334625 RepID=A0A7R9LUI7_9ACAR|nr:unnamed protein product [Oppiella nova]CAG2167098.1 unnamed protein product [Oppiella nova]
MSVSVEKGVIVGNTRPTVDGKQVNEFLGIPYAKPPKGDLRFRKPVPTDSWSQPLVADKWPNPCHQPPLLVPFMQNKNLSEDCLYLNIWSPFSKVRSAQLKPVMFYAYGGGLTIGSSSELHYRGEVLATRGDLIVVNFNYRLNGFGFLYTGTDDVPGNMGLWDQALALEWVHKNIKNFGGDPDKITIFGESAGSTTTSALILSPITRNLFKNAIMMSGSADPPTRPLSGLGSGIRQVSYFVADGAFLPKRPHEMLESGDFHKELNLMIGNCEDEGGSVLQVFAGPLRVDAKNQLGGWSGNSTEIMQYWLKISKQMNCTDDQTPDKFTPKIIDCLKNIDPKTLATYTSVPLDQLGSGIRQVSYFVADGAFLPKRPHEMLESGDFHKDLNLMIGNCEDEGGSVLQVFAGPLRIDAKKFDFHNPTPITYTEAYNITKNLFSSLILMPPINGEEVAKLYFTGLSDKTPQDALRLTIGIAFGDWVNTCANIGFAKGIYKKDPKSNVYQYYFNSKISDWSPFCGPWMGVCHGNDVDHVFGIPFLDTKRFVDREREISQQMMDIFTTFARTGFGGAEWPQYYNIGGKTIARIMK